MKENIEAIFPLTPMQRGMLFHASFDENQHAYFQQVRCNFEGRIDQELMKSSWLELINRHQTLRSAFIWKHQKDSMQVVMREIDLPITFLDWSHKDTNRVTQDLEAFLVEDRKKTFNLSKPPLMRLTLIQTNTTQFELIWSHHHILIDGWSTGLLFKEFQQIYQAKSTGTALAMRPVFQHKDYLNWFKSKDEAQDQAFWNSYLSEVESSVSVPKDRKGLDTTAEEYSYNLSAQLTEQLETLAAQNQVTLNVLFLGAWGLLLSKYQDAKEILLGVTVSGRPASLTNIENGIGLFINSLPFRIATPPQEDLNQWLNNIQQDLLKVRSYEHSSLSQIKEWSNLPASAPLFESLFVYENYPISSTLEQEFGNIRLKSASIFERTNYPLTLVVEPHQGKTTLRLLYQPSRILPEDIKQITTNFSELLESLTAVSIDRVTLPLQAIPFVKPETAHKIIYDWNDTNLPFDEEVLMHQRFEQQCELTPQHVAVVDDEGAINYLETNEAANQIAHSLLESGLAKGEYVAVFFDRNKAMIPALFGILKAGGVYVPIDIDYPVGRISYILNNLKIRFALSQAHHVTALTTTQAIEAENIICLDQKGKIDQLNHSNTCLISNTTDNPNLVISATAYAYVIFTSGTTGTPKGVTVTHRPVSNLIEWITREFDMSEKDQVLLVSSLCFDLSVYDIFGLLSVGGSIRVASNEAVKDPKQLLQLILSEPITFWDSAPAALQQLVPFLPEKAVNSHLRLIFQSGDWIPLSLPDKMKQTFPKVAFISLGGATEATVWSNYFPVHELNPNWRSIPYGRPIQNAYYYVLDGQLNPCPVGVPGDLYIGGECLSSLYANAPELTARKFIPDPFSKKEGGRMYFTGDKACFYPDGNIEFLGRIDGQVKLRGYRIELGEVQSTLAQHDAIDSAIALIKESKDGHRHLITYYTPEADKRVSEKDLKEFLAQSLPSYMIPSAIVKLSIFPITPNGKLDRAALPNPLQKTQQSINDLKPINAIEELIWNNWTELIGSKPAARDANFFESGGHSLLATRFIARIGTALSLEVPIRSIFDYPTPELFYNYLSGLYQQEDSKLIPWQNTPEQTYHPLSFAQERLWFLYLLKPESSFYNVPLTLTINGHLNVDALRRTVQEIVHRHKIFRSSYHTIDGKGKQQIHTSIDLPWVLLDLENEKLSKEEGLNRLKAEAQLPFNLEQSPLLRVLLVKVADQEYIFQLTTHHICVDGWSIGILVSELNLIYNAFANHQALDLAPLAYDYADYAQWQRKHFENGLLTKQLDYWQQKLNNFTTLELPKRNTTTTIENKVFRATLDQQQSEAIVQFSQENNSTTFMTLLTAFSIQLHLISKQNDIVIGTDVAGRSHLNTESMVGFFVNQIVLRNTLSPSMKCKELLKQVRTNTLEAYQHQDLPFEKLVQHLNPKRLADKTPFFQVKLVLQNNELAEVNMADLEVRPMLIEPNDSKYDLLITFDQHSSNLSVSIEYKSHLYSSAMIEKWWGDLQFILTRMTTSVDDSIAKLDELLTKNRENHNQEKRMAGLSKLRKLGRNQRKTLTISTED